MLFRYANCCTIHHFRVSTKMVRLPIMSKNNSLRIYLCQLSSAIVSLFNYFADSSAAIRASRASIVFFKVSTLPFVAILTLYLFLVYAFVSVLNE